jgi:hypothetical protein
LTERRLRTLDARSRSITDRVLVFRADGTGVEGSETVVLVVIGGGALVGSADDRTFAGDPAVPAPGLADSGADVHGVLPTRTWSDEQWERIKLGYEARGMDEKWDVFVEDQMAFLHRS